MTDATGARTSWRDVALFFVLACGFTWLADAPLALAWLRRETPPEYALSLAGLGAFGPTLAALVVAGWRHELRGVFGRWRCDPRWVLLGLATPLLVHLPATALEVALGGHPARWFYPPGEPALVAAMVVFSVGEEFGWRGFAYPRLAALHGPVVGSLIVGAVWGVWHLGMMFTPERGAPDPALLAYAIAELALASVVFAWMFERSGRSMAVAIALHAGAHLDNPGRAPEFELRLRLLHLAMWAIAAALAARALARDAARHDTR